VCIVEWYDDIINIFVDRAEEEEEKRMEQSIDQCLTILSTELLQHPNSYREPLSVSI
jgi:hypothetical protein